MSQSLNKVVVHIIFSTKNRVKIIDEAIAGPLYKYLGGICRNLECDSIEISGYLDHVHILCRLSKKITIVNLLEQLKKSSSYWIKTQGNKYADFYWQGGYCIQSVSPLQIDKVAAYIRNQVEHHRETIFEDEFRKILEENGIEFDERYLWN